MEKWATVVLQQAKTVLDKVKVYEVKILTCIAQRNRLEAVKIGIQVLEQLGVSLPSVANTSGCSAEVRGNNGCFEGEEHRGLD